MNIFGSLWHGILAVGHVAVYQPLFNALVLLYTYIPGNDMGIAIIILTLGVKFVLYPLGAKAFYSARALSLLQPKIQELNEKFKQNKEELSRKIFELYKQEKVNPFSTLVPLLLQIPVFIALYSVVQNGFHAEQLSILYPFVQSPGPINAHFLGIVSLEKPSLIFAILAGILQFIQGKQSLSLSTLGAQKNNQANKSMAQAQAAMIYAFPFITIVILLRLPSALGLYWITTSIFSIWQQWYLAKKSK